MRAICIIFILSFILSACHMRMVDGATPVIYELVYASDAHNLPPLQKPASVQHEYYSWNNRQVIITEAKDSQYWKRFIVAVSGVDSVKMYREPFYVFNRSHCAQQNTAPRPWKNILLTADLVADTARQAAYMNYHKNQFEQWPEVSKGFCNASFQQLLVYRSGRQLMLMISIPADSSLEKLNPKTTENNPRVDEWNKLMSQYQEGIPGTAPGETWVFMNKTE